MRYDELTSFLASPSLNQSFRLPLLYFTNEASFQKMKRRRGASSSFVLKPALTSTSTSAAIVRLYGYGFLIILMGQIFCKYCEGVNAASFGQRVELESTDANKNTHQVPEIGRASCRERV